MHVSFSLWSWKSLSRTFIILGLSVLDFSPNLMTFEGENTFLYPSYSCNLSFFFLWCSHLRIVSFFISSTVWIKISLKRTFILHALNLNLRSSTCIFYILVYTYNLENTGKSGCLFCGAFLLEYGFFTTCEVWRFKKPKIELALELGSGMPSHFWSTRLRLSYSRLHWRGNLLNLSVWSFDVET